MQRRTPLTDLPENYVEVLEWRLIGFGRYMLLNLVALVPMALAIVWMAGWLILLSALRDTPVNTGNGSAPLWLGFIVIVAVLPLHEWLHGIGIAWAGHKPRYGMKAKSLVLYATADNALFWRNHFIVIALLPLLGITLLGMLWTGVVSDGVLVYSGVLAVVLNAAAAVGDLWMVGLVLRYPMSALVRDEADGIRVYVQMS